jgi:hypothetical protein
MQGITIVIDWINCEFFSFQFRLSIKDRVENNLELEGYQTITVQEIREWHRILIKIREQAMRAGSGTALRELILIAIAIYNVSSGLFSFGYLLLRNTKLELLYVVMAMSVESTVRILIKVSKAVKVAQEV